MEKITFPRDYYAEYVPKYPITSLTLAGENIRSFTILSDRSDEEAYACALDFRLRLYRETGVWLQIQPTGSAVEYPFYFRTVSDATSPDSANRVPSA